MNKSTGVQNYRAKCVREALETGIYPYAHEDIETILKKIRVDSMTVGDITKYFIKMHGLEESIKMNSARAIVDAGLKRLEKEGKVIKVDKGRWHYNR